jgi:predicted RecA/RadA family phage recombinase
MKTFLQQGDVLTLAPPVSVASGVGYLFGVGLFGVATGDVAAAALGEFRTEGVVSIAKTGGLAISVGDRLFWDPAGKCVNKTLAAQQCVGIAVADAIAAATTVSIKLNAYVAVAA